MAVMVLFILLPPSSTFASRIVLLLMLLLVGLMVMSKSSGLMLRFSVTVLMEWSGSPAVTPTPSSRTRMLRNVRRYFSASLVDRGCGPVGGVVVVGVPVTGSTVMGEVVLIS